jgi:hypothetical protein
MASDQEINQQKLRVNDWKTLLELPSGRRILTHILLDLAGTHRGVFSTNALSMAHAEGRRSLGQSIENEIEAARPGAYAGLLSDLSKETINV